MALGVEQARHTHPPSARARGLNDRQEHQEDSSWLWSSGLRPASAGGAGCPGCGRLLQPPGPVTAPQNCPSAAYSTASQPLPPPKGCTIGHIAPPPTGSRAGARRGRLGARTARKVRTSTAARPPQGCRTAVLASQGAHRLLWLLRRRPLRWPLLRWPASSTTAGGRCTRAFPRGRRRAARAQLLAHGTRRHSAAENRRCSARSARDLDFQGWIRPFQGYTFENPPRPTLLVTLSISRLSNTKCCDRGWPISFFFPFFGSCGHPS